MSAGTRASSAAEIVEAIGGRDTITVDVAGVTIETVDAAVCGALGCRDEDGLVRAKIDGFGARIVCPDHLEELIEREADG